MSGRNTDVAIVGGGLAGGLIALALRQRCPDLPITLIEQGDTLGGNHRWSWFESDLGDQGRELLVPFRCKGWNAGYDVLFPEHTRTLGSSYRSLVSDDFHAALMLELGPQSVMLGASAQDLEAGRVSLSDGSEITARAVIDCRPFVPSAELEGGWQIFLGRHIRLDRPHGLTRPTIMDASVTQHAPYGNGDAYRFVYVLPLADDEVFIEDTYYADEPRLDKTMLASRIDAYQHAKGWTGQIVGEETGILPVITGGDFDAFRRGLEIDGVAMAGARGGFTHPLTSYTVPIAVENALAIGEAWANNSQMDGPSLAKFCRKRSRQHWRRTGFYRLLGRMLFGAAEPSRRVNIFQRFYRLPEGLIERFYSAHSTRFDRFRILCGKPPVSIPRAIRALANSGAPLSSEKLQ